MGGGPRPRLARFLPVYHGSGGAYLVLRSLVVVEAVAPVWLWRWVTRLVKLGVQPCWSADGTR